MRKARTNLLRSLLLTSILCLALAVTAVVLFGALRLRSEALRASREQLLSSATGSATEIENSVKSALSTAESVAKIFSRIKAEQDRLEIGRLEIRSILGSVLEAHPELASVYTAWEPEALDGLDGANHNQAGSDAAGRVLPCVIRNNAKQTNLTYLSGLDDPKFNPWYALVRKTNRAAIVGPIQRHVGGQAGAWVIAAVAPIKQGEKFLGVVGVDLSMDCLQGSLARIQLYDGAARASLYHNDGTLLAGETNAQALNLEAVRKSSQALMIDTADKAIAVAPISWLGEGTQWCLSIAVPAARITRHATQAALLMLLIGLAGATTGAAWLAARIRYVNRVVKSAVLALESSSQSVDEASSQLSRASQSLAEGTSHQASTLEETSASLEEMSSMTRRNADNAHQANELAKQARTAADKGTSDMSDMAKAMQDIKASSGDIAKIIKTIDEIAFQTNILALNAAVEAARAGESGLGFAVVADEVRSLAQRSAEAAKETTEKIEGAIGKTAQGVQLSAKVALGLQGIVHNIHTVDQLVAEVAIASREQTQGIAQVNTAVGQMDKAMQSNTASAEESASAARMLNSQAALLRQAVGELIQLVGGTTVANGEAGMAIEPEEDSPSQARASRAVRRSTSPARDNAAPASLSRNGAPAVICQRP